MLSHVNFMFVERVKETKISLSCLRMSSGVLLYAYIVLVHCLEFYVVFSFFYLHELIFSPFLLQHYVKIIIIDIIKKEAH